MKLTDPDSYAKFYKNEPMTAAYLGYNNVGDFRRLRFHPITLYWYASFHLICSGRGAKIAMTILRDRRDRSCLGGNLPELLSNFPIATEVLSREQKTIDNGNRDHVYAGIFYHTSVHLDRAYIYAGILYHMANSIENLDPPAGYDPISIIAAFNTQLSTGTVPEVIGTVVKPKLGPFIHLQECELERYSRVNALLKSLQHSLAPSKWVDAFRKDMQPFPATEVHTSSIPVWMRCAPGDPKSGTRNLSSSSAEPDHPVSVVIRLDRSVQTRWSAELAKHEVKFIKFHDFRLPTKDIAERDPLDYPYGAMWRDTLRRQLRFETLQVDFRSITTDNDAETCMYSLSQPELVVPWTKFLDTIRLSPMLKYTLHVVSDDDFSYEYDGPPLGIVDDVAVADDDVGIIGDNTTISSLLRPYERMGETLMRTLDQVQGSANVSSPEHFFRLPEEMELLMTYHDGYEAFPQSCFTIEIGLTWRPVST